MSFAPPQIADRSVSLRETVTSAAGASRAENVDTSALDLTLRALRPFLTADVTDLCINTPGEAFLDASDGWHRVSLPFANFDWCRRLAKLVAHSTRQRIAEDSPLLSAWLPSGERAEMVLPPATSAGSVGITIRKPSDATWSLDELASRGI